MGDEMPPPPQEKTVDLNVASGKASQLAPLTSDGTTVIAKTPDGTRVPTPAQGATPAAGATASGSTAAGTPAKQGSYASAVKAPPVDWHLEFRMNDVKLSMQDTVYGVIHKHGRSPAGVDPLTFNAFSANNTITYRKVPGPMPAGMSSMTHTGAQLTLHRSAGRQCSSLTRTFVTKVSPRFTSSGRPDSQDTAAAQRHALAHIRCSRSASSCCLITVGRVAFRQ